MTRRTRGVFSGLKRWLGRNGQRVLVALCLLSLAGNGYLLYRVNRLGEQTAALYSIAVSLTAALDSLTTALSDRTSQLQHM